MYVTKAEYRGDHSVSQQMITTASSQTISDNDLDKLLERASRFFDLLCGVEPGYFEAAETTASERTFYGDGTNFLKLDRYVPGSLNTSITFPEGYTTPDFTERDGYLVLTDSAGVLPSRFTERCGGGWYARVPITISAKWGFEATPEDVKHAVIELAVNLWRETDPANVKLVNLEGQPLREKYPPRVKEIANRYRAQMGVLV